MNDLVTKRSNEALQMVDLQVIYSTVAAQWSTSSNVAINVHSWQSLSSNLEVHDTVQYSTVHYSTAAVQYSTHYSTAAVQYSTVQHSTVQYTTVQQ